MDDELAEIFLAVEKLVPDPEQVVLPLLVERNPRPDTGMDEEEIAAEEEWFQALQKPQMIARHRRLERPDQLGLLGCTGIKRGLDTVGHQGLQSADLSPVVEL